MRPDQLHGLVEAVPANVHQADLAAAEREQKRQTMPHGAGADDRYLIEGFHLFPYLSVPAAEAVLRTIRLSDFGDCRAAFSADHRLAPCLRFNSLRWTTAAYSPGVERRIVQRN